MNKWPKVLIFTMVAAAGTVLNTVLLLVVLFRGSPAGPAGAGLQNDRSAQAAARANLCAWLSKRGPFDLSNPPLGGLAAQIHGTRDDAEALLATASEDKEAGRFRCSSSGTGRINGESKAGGKGTWEPKLALNVQDNRSTLP